MKNSTLGEGREKLTDPRKKYGKKETEEINENKLNLMFLLKMNKHNAGKSLSKSLM